MKKIISLLLSLTLIISLAACSSKQEGSSFESESASSSESQSASGSESSEQSSSVSGDFNVMVIAGPTGIGAVNMMKGAEEGIYENNYSFSVAQSPDEVAGKIISGDVDIAAVPTNLASVLFNKTEGKIKILGVNTLGVLYMLELNDSVKSVSDLKGKTIYTTGLGANPQYILEYVLRENGIDPENDLTINYKTENTELAAALEADPNAVVMAPQPVATSIVLNQGAKVCLDMTEEWDKTGNGSSLMMGCLIARTDTLEKNPDAIEAFMADYADSILDANDDPAATGQLCEEYGIVPKAALAEKAIPLCNITWETGDSMAEALSGYLNVLFEADPSSVGGSVPGRDLYY